MIATNKKFFAKLVSHALNARKAVIRTSARAHSVHIASCLSPIEILVSLYFDAMNIDPRRPEWPDRDRLVLSKGHGGLGLYAVLAERGFIPRRLLEHYGEDATPLTVHPVHRSVPGIETTTGSLGHGLSMGAGMAFAAKRDKKKWRTFVVLSDGECDEGATWEAAMLAGHHTLDNLVAIVDYNKIQSFGRTKEILDLEPFADKWRANHWEAISVDGHSFPELIAALRNVPKRLGKPTVIIAHTVKGKGVPHMEDKLEWHYRNVEMKDLEETIGNVY